MFFCTLKQQGINSEVNNTAYFWCLNTCMHMCTCVGYMYACMLSHMSALLCRVQICKWTDCVCLSLRHMYPSIYSACSHIEACQMWVCALVVCVSLCTHIHTNTSVWISSWALISFHSDTWFPWEACDTTREQKGTWTQPSAYLQHTPLLIKDN